MKKILQKLFVIISLFAFISLSTIAISTTTYATDVTNNNDNDTSQTTNKKSSNCRYFLGMPSWDCGLKDWNGEKNLTNNIIKIVENVADAITKIVAYLLVGYVIYGGYLYIFSSGDPAKAVSGKKTISRAFIGLAIVVFANIIISSAGIAMLGSSGAFDQDCTIAGNCANGSPEVLIENIVNWVIGVAGVVSVVYVVIGGIGYITSAGDSSKLQKSKTTITYSLIGLTIVGLSLIISNNGIAIIEAANTGERIEDAVLNLLNSVIGFTSTIAVVFAVKGGFMYMTSTGDPSKIKAAKDTILYACIGLIICAISFVIVNWAIGVINNSSESTENTSYLQTDSNGS